MKVTIFKRKAQETCLKYTQRMVELLTERDT